MMAGRLLPGFGGRFSSFYWFSSGSTEIMGIPERPSLALPLVILVYCWRWFAGGRRAVCPIFLAADHSWLGFIGTDADRACFAGF